MSSTIRRLRVNQIRFTARVLRMVERLPGGNRLLRRVASWPITAPILNAMLGYHRVFNSFSDAVAAARPYEDGGFEHPEYAKRHLPLAEAPGWRLARLLVRGQRTPARARTKAPRIEEILTNCRRAELISLEHGCYL
jgi:hypothetical protein